MPRQPNYGKSSQAVRPPRPGSRSAWKLEDAKAQFSEVVRRARAEGPQHVTVRGKEAVVVIAVETLNRLLPEQARREDLVTFLQGLKLEHLDLTRESDIGRDFPP